MADASNTIVIAPGSYGIAAACGLLPGESYELEFGVGTDCNTACWLPVKECGLPVILDEDNNPRPFAKEYQGFFRWVPTAPVNDNVRFYVQEVTGGASK